MSLVPHPITAIERDVADASISGKQVIVGATCSMFLQPLDSTVIMYDDAAGSNGSTAKTTGINGQVIVYIEPGTYRISVNGQDSFIYIADENIQNENGVTPQKFGAVADGVTDDSNALQDWANVGGRLYLLKGLYRVTRQINFTKPCFVFGETAGSGTGGTLGTLLQEAAAGASIIYPDVAGFVGDAVFNAENPEVEFKSLPSISFSNFKIHSPQTLGVAAHLLRIINGYDAIFLQNLNLLFQDKDHSALVLDVIEGTTFPNLSQTGIIENVVCIGDNSPTGATAPTIYIHRQQEMQFIGVKAFATNQVNKDDGDRNCIEVEDSRGLVFLGCSSAFSGPNHHGLAIYSKDRDVDGIAVSGHTFESCQGGGWTLDAVTRNNATWVVSKVNVKDARYQFPQSKAGNLVGATQCDVDTGTGEVIISNSATNNTVQNLFQAKVTDTSGNSTNTVITPTGATLSGRHYNQGLTVQKDSAVLNLISADESEGWRILASVAAATNLGLDFRTLDGDTKVTITTDGDIKLQKAGADIRALTPDGLTEYKFSFDDNGDPFIRAVLDSSDVHINNDRPFTSVLTTYTFDNAVIGGTIYRDQATANNVVIPEDATPFTINAQVVVIQRGVGEVTIQTQNGVTLDGVLTSKTLITAGVNSGYKLVKIGANEWISIATGNTSTSSLATKVHITVNQNTTTDVHIITYDAAIYDDLGAFSGVNPARLTVPAGVERVDVSAYVQYATSSVTTDTPFSFRIEHFSSAGTLIDVVAATTQRSGYSSHRASICELAVAVSSGDYFTSEVQEGTAVEQLARARFTMVKSK